MNKKIEEDERRYIWTVYKFPTDYPGEYIARRSFVNLGHDRPPPEKNYYPTDNIIRSTDLKHIRIAMEERQLLRVERNPNDDPKIVECWI